MNQTLQALVRQGGGKLSKRVTAAILTAWDAPGRPHGVLGRVVWFVTLLAHGVSEVHVRPLPAMEFHCPSCAASHPLQQVRVEHSPSATRLICPSTGELLCEV